MVNKVDTAAAAKAFELPNGVVVGEDGKTLVDERPFYKTRLTHSTLATLQEQFTANKAQEQENNAWSFMTPFNFVGGVLKTVYNAVVDAFKAIFGLCFSYGAKEDAAEATKEKSEAKKA